MRQPTPNPAQDKWCAFDALVVAVSIAGVGIDLGTEADLAFLPLLRMLRVARVFRLIPRAKGLNTLLRTLVCCLWEGVLIYYRNGPGLGYPRQAFLRLVPFAPLLTPVKTQPPSSAYCRFCRCLRWAPRAASCSCSSSSGPASG